MISEDIHIRIHHLDGREVNARFSTSCTVQDVVRTLVAKPRGQNRILHKGKLLQFKAVLSSLAEAGELVLHVLRNAVAGGGSWFWHSKGAFAAIKDDGSVVTWGYAEQGGDSTSVADKLSGVVVQISSSDRAFAVLKGDGSVVTWGCALAGGDSTSVADKLHGGVVQISSTQQAFAAIKDDGSVVT